MAFFSLSSFAELVIVRHESVDDGFTQTLIALKNSPYVIRQVQTVVFPANVAVATTLKSLKVGVDYQCDADLYQNKYQNRSTVGSVQAYQNIVYRSDSCVVIRK